jgi:anti-sigma B factor antagonist
MLTRLEPWVTAGGRSVCEATVVTDQLSIEIVPRPDCVTLRLSGEIDMYTASHLREAALLATNRFSTALHLDMAGVTFMDSTGVQVLVATRHRLDVEGGHMKLLSPGRQVVRVLEVTGIDHLFEIEASPTSVGVT